MSTYSGKLVHDLDRYWINQPSGLQEDHKLHGKLVLADPDNYEGEVCRCYFTEGPVTSSMIFKRSLSKGWPEHLVSVAANSEMAEILRQLRDCSRYPCNEEGSADLRFAFETFRTKACAVLKKAGLETSDKGKKEPYQ